MSGDQEKASGKASVSFHCISCFSVVSMLYVSRKLTACLDAAWQASSRGPEELAQDKKVFLDMLTDCFTNGGTCILPILSRSLSGYFTHGLTWAGVGLLQKFDTFPRSFRGTRMATLSSQNLLSFFSCRVRLHLRRPSELAPHLHFSYLLLPVKPGSASCLPPSITTFNAI